jgi:hypothetical protein
VHDQLAHALASGLVRPALDVTLETLNVAEHLREVLPDRGLVRGRIVSCSGDAAMSLALQVVSRATQDGSWLAAVGVDHLGLVAAHEHRVALERLVVVNPGDVVGDWVAAVGIAVEGFGVVLLNVPRGLSARDAQRITTRIQSRRAVAVCVDSTRRVAGGQGFVPDVVLHTTTVAWHGIDEGSGHVRSREVCVEVSGRRVARPSRHTLHHVG